MTKDEALKQWADDVSRAYDILAFGHTERAVEILAKTRNAMREALAQPQQEPLAVHQFRSMYSAAWEDGHPDPKDGYGPYKTRTLYTAPPRRTWLDASLKGRQKRKPLSYVELMALAKNSGLGPENVSGLIQARLEIYGRAIETKLRSKNT